MDGQSRISVERAYRGARNVTRLHGHQGSIQAFQICRRFLGPVGLREVLDIQHPTQMCCQRLGAPARVVLDETGGLRVARQTFGHRVFVGLDQRAVGSVPLGTGRAGLGAKLVRAIPFGPFRLGGRRVRNPFRLRRHCDGWRRWRQWVGRFGTGQR